VRFAAADSAASTMFTMAFFDADVSEVENILKGMSSDRRILNDKPFSRFVWKVSIQWDP